MIDTHVHLTNEAFQEDLAEVLQRAKTAGIEKMLLIAYDLPSSYEVVALAKQHKELFCAVGIHPSDASSWTDEVQAALENLLQKKEENKIVAVGEIGLDYYWENIPREPQREVFLKQIEMAFRHDLPFVVHDREAHADCLSVLLEAKEKGFLRKVPGVMHCYSSSAEFAKHFLALGMYIGFDGPLTYKKAVQPVEACASIPLDRLLVETDCPYLAPQSKRGKRNEPAYVVEVAQKMADIHGLSYEEMEKNLTENAHRLFSRLCK